MSTIPTREQRRWAGFTFEYWHDQGDWHARVLGETQEIEITPPIREAIERDQERQRRKERGE